MTIIVTPSTRIAASNTFCRALFGDSAIKNQKNLIKFDKNSKYTRGYWPNFKKMVKFERLQLGFSRTDLQLGRQFT